MAPTQLGRGGSAWGRGGKKEKHEQNNDKIDLASYVYNRRKKSLLSSMEIRCQYVV